MSMAFEFNKRAIAIVDARFEMTDWMIPDYLCCDNLFLKPQIQR